MVGFWEIKILHLIYVSHKIFCMKKMKFAKVHYKKITNHVIKSFCLWVNVFLIVIKQWHSNVFSFKWLVFFFYCTCANFWNFFYQEWIFICFIWTIMRKKIYFNVWFVKQFGTIVMYSIFDNLCYNVKW